MGDWLPANTMVAALSLPDLRAAPEWIDNPPDADWTRGYWDVAIP